MKDDRDDNAPLHALRDGFRQRTLATVKGMARVGLRLAKRNLSGAEAVASVDEERAVAWAETLREELDQLKGLGMKVGQMMSYLDTSIPPRARRVLAKLQFQSRPMAFERIAGVVRDALRHEPHALFDTFDPDPFAAASIGQVHRATKNGRELAVKVQYPEIQRLMAADLRVVGRLTRFATLIGPLDGKALMEELSARVLEECDYEREAESQSLFHAAFRGRTDITVPQVLHDLSATTVLTTEHIDRLGFHAFAERADPSARDRAGALVFEAAFRSIFHHAAYNADPHPGNYLFTETGDLTLLDFGCVKRFSVPFIETWKRLARSILDNDLAAFRTVFTEAGFVHKPKKFDFEHQLAAMRVLYEGNIATEPYAFTERQLQKVHDALIFQNQNKLRMTLPPEWLWVNRLQLGMFSVLHLLGSRVLWGEIFREMLELPVVPLETLG